MKTQVINKSVLFICGALFVSSASAFDLARNEFGYYDSELDGINGNASSVELSNATNSKVFIRQNSPQGWKGNKAMVRQSGNNNVAVANQNGVNNFAYLDQNGNDNIAAVYQNGWNNKGIIIQNGNENFAALVQNGNNSREYINQQGDGNKAVVVERPGVSYSGYNINQSGNEQLLIVNGMNKNISVH
ncbi:hypothetical protein [Photobacterium sp. Hal280]|uniref:hypothetical protein n=1 Tax=Photobacterium sp. Hal280 TaxID=3035163 RepID=UPI00301D93CA